MDGCHLGHCSRRWSWPELVDLVGAARAASLSSVLDLNERHAALEVELTLLDLELGRVLERVLSAR